MTGTTEDVKIVVAVDGSPGCDGALRYAVEEARRHGCGLHVVHVGPTYLPMTPMLPYVPGDLEAVGREILRTAEGVATVAARGEVEVITTALLSGSRTSELVDAGSQGRQLVVGQETRTGLERILTGAVTAAVVAHARVPVTVVPGAWSPGDEHGVVVVGIAHDEHVEALLEAAFEAASQRGARLRVLHAWNLPDPYADRIEERTHGEDWLTAGTERLRTLLAGWSATHPQVTVEIDVVHDLPARALVRAAADADLLLLVRRGSRARSGHHLGATARTVITAASAPVEVLPPPPVGPGPGSPGRAGRGRPGGR